MHADLFFRFIRVHPRYSAANLILGVFAPWRKNPVSERQVGRILSGGI
jgi:hypothetical protein